MRVMYIQPAEVFGGAERQGVLHISGLRRLGVEVVAVVGPTPLIRGALERRGVRDYVYVDEFFCEEKQPLTALGQLAFDLRRAKVWFWMQWFLSRLGRQRQVDVVVANRSVGWLVGSPAARYLGVPLVWRGGGRPTRRVQSAVMRTYARIWGPDLLLANCEAVRAGVSELVSCPCEVLPNGVDTQHFDPARVAPRFRQELGLGEKTPVIGLAARPAPEKNLELLAEAVLRVSRLVPDARLLIAGEFGWRKHYEELYASLGLAGRATFLGHVEDVERFYASCDVVVLTSHNHSIEGSPNAVLEAMSMARPVVATRVGGLPEIIEHGVEGFLSPPDDAQSFAAYLTRLLTDRALRAEMGARGRATIERRFSEWAVTSKLATTLQALVARAAVRALPGPVVRAETGSRGGG